MTREEQKQLIKTKAEASLEFFIETVHPQRVLGAIHKELIQWWTREDAKTHQLVLLPRDHGKSAMIAYRVAWELTRNPALRILYISSTSNLAVKQLKFIKDILTCDNYRYLWPEMVNVQETLRVKWTESEISVDHPIRKYEAIRDPSIFTAGLTTSITGLHCDIAVLDDVVVQENAYTEEGRDKTEQQYSLLSSIETGGAREWVVGTRYHPKDLYQTLMEMQVEVFDDEGNVKDFAQIYEIFERQVESRGDGTGQFLWPRQQRTDGKWFGFDQNILAVKRGQYRNNRVQFRAQYYNNPNDNEESAISREYFQYYDQKYLKREGSYWYYKDKRLNTFASIDFAFSLSKLADSTAIVVVGVDADRNFYILDIERFKTNKIGDYFKKILDLHVKWGFKKLRAEINVAQEAIVEELKQGYIRKHGLNLSIVEHRPSKSEGSKEERVMAVLQPKYQDRQMWHYMGGHCQTLEEELVLENPPHDDVKDALASCVEIAVPPTINRSLERTTMSFNYSHTRFGGIA